MRISIYGHSGSYNHGNEAIVRGVAELFSNEIINLYSFDPDIDIKFDLDKVSKIYPFFNTYKKYSFNHLRLSFLARILNKNMMYNKLRYKTFLKNINGIYLLEAGDQYCETDNLRRFYARINKEINSRGGKTVMLGCTINEEFLQEDVINDLKMYSLIVARESITYNALLNVGLTKNTILAPDPAFVMKSEAIELPNIFEKKVVGINVGFLKQGNEKYLNLMMKNIYNLIRYILSNTNYNIALIPHVNWNKNNSDFNTLNTIFKDFRETKRIEVVNEHNAANQKYIMSKCDFMVALRTHVSVPSIAAQVPTLITGYKVKSTGIVRDIFPNEYEVLADVGSLQSDDEYVKHFKWMQNNEQKLRKYMKKNIPEYINKTEIIVRAIKEINK